MESTTLRPGMKLFNYTPCEVASKQETNSASIVEVAVKVCFALLQDTAPLASIKHNPMLIFGYQCNQRSL